MTERDTELTARILGLWRDYELDPADLLWHVHDGRAHFSVICSDFFTWGCADAEEIGSIADLEALEQAVLDAAVLQEEDWGPRLWVARKRGMRPQGACYRTMPEAVWSLFDACGPARTVEFGNPRRHPSEDTE